MSFWPCFVYPGPKSDFDPSRIQDGIIPDKHALPIVIAPNPYAALADTEDELEYSNNSS